MIPIIGKKEIPTEIFFEKNSIYLYQRRKNKARIRVKYIAEFMATKGKGGIKKKKHLFIETETNRRFTISCDAVRITDFEKS